MEFYPHGRVVTTSFSHVAVVAVTMMIPVYLGFHNNVSVELGYEHYAEKANSTLGPFQFPQWVLMPANTIVNVGYPAVGFFWLHRVASCDGPFARYKPEDLYLVSVFASMACVYGMVQFLRIVTQSHFWSVLDQWYTLPFFSWTIVWSRKLKSSWNTKSAILIVVASILSYNLSLLHKFGFEVALGMHIISAIYNGCQLLSANWNGTNFMLLCLVLINCSGFVLLKLADFHLARLPIFQELTGHFWSKVCDFLQIHFTTMFFVRIVRDSKTE